MKPLDDRLNRLLRAARAAATPTALTEPKPPFGFDTRVLASLATARGQEAGDLFNLVFRQALIWATTVLCLSVAINYRALADFATVIQDPDVHLVRVAQATADSGVSFSR